MMKRRRGVEFTVLQGFIRVLREEESCSGTGWE